MKFRADVLLVTVTKVETLAVFDALKKHGGSDPEARGIADKTFFSLGIINGATVWLVQAEMGSGGVGATHQTVDKGIAALSPGAVIMVGIAFGVDEEKQTIGDVLVSRQLMLYDLQRAGTWEGELQIKPRGDRPHASAWLIDRFRAAELTWLEANVEVGLVLTGEKLVDNLKLRQQLLALEPEAIGGEMEGAGLYVACHDAKVDWMLVKAVCDWADGEKHVGKKERQAIAARNAASFVLHALRLAPLKREGFEQSGPADVPSGGATTIIQRGDGAIAVGPGSVAAGAGGVAVGGSGRVAGAGQGRKRAGGPATSTQREQIFISYSHRDARWLDELKTHLVPYVRVGGLEVWSDEAINAGARWREEIEAALERASVAVLLVSPNFLASDFIAKHELPALFAAARNEESTILWIPVSSSAYEVTEINAYQAVLTPSRPLDRMKGPAERNRAFVKICQTIMEAATVSASPKG